MFLAHASRSSSIHNWSMTAGSATSAPALGLADPVASRAAVVWQMEGGGPSFWVALRA